MKQKKHVDHQKQRVTAVSNLKARRRSSSWKLGDSHVGRAIGQGLLALAERCEPRATQQEGSAGKTNAIYYSSFIYLFIASANHLVKANQRKRAREPIVYSTWINVLHYKK